MEIDVVVDERTRREIYLPPFEAAVRRARVWAVMAAYNRVDGRYCSEHPGLLTDLLRGEWGFDGLVMSDWFGTHATATLTAGLDLEMPGPANAPGPPPGRRRRGGRRHRRGGRAGRAAVLDLIDRTAPSRLNAGERPAGRGPRRRPRRRHRGDRAARQRRRAAAGARRSQPTWAIGAVIGWRGRAGASGPGRRQRPGDAAVRHHPLQGISDRAARASVTFEAGRTSPDGADQRPPGDPTTAPRGVGDPASTTSRPATCRATPLRTETVRETMAVWLGEPAPGVTAGDFSARLTAAFTPTCRARGPCRCPASARPACSSTASCWPTRRAPRPAPSSSASSPSRSRPRSSSRPAPPTRWSPSSTPTPPRADPAGGPHRRGRPPAQPDAVERAVQAAAGADVAVVVVGQDDRETEGKDATSMDLPPDQVALVRQVAAANPRRSSWSTPPRP